MLFSLRDTGGQATVYEMKYPVYCHDVHPKNQELEWVCSSSGIMWQLMEKAYQNIMCLHFKVQYIQFV